jgi:hypothetical protein
MDKHALAVSDRSRSLLSLVCPYSINTIACIGGQSIIPRTLLGFCQSICSIQKVSISSDMLTMISVKPRLHSTQSTLQNTIVLALVSLDSSTQCLLLMRAIISYALIPKQFIPFWRLVRTWVISKSHRWNGQIAVVCPSVTTLQCWSSPLQQY